jgi:hypothetical protein
LSGYKTGDCPKDEWWRVGVEPGAVKKGGHDMVGFGSLVLGSNVACGYFPSVWAEIEQKQLPCLPDLQQSLHLNYQDGNFAGLIILGLPMIVADKDGEEGGEGEPIAPGSDKVYPASAATLLVAQHAKVVRTDGLQERLKSLTKQLLEAVMLPERLSRISSKSTLSWRPRRAERDLGIAALDGSMLRRRRRVTGRGGWRGTWE